MPKRLLRYSRTEPARTIIGIVSIILLASALWVFTPLYDPFFGPSFNQLGLFTTASGIVMLVMSLPGLYGTKSGKPRHIAIGAFFLFLYFVFNAFVRILVTGFASISWVPLLVLALIMGVIYVEQNHVARRDA